MNPYLHVERKNEGLAFAYDIVWREDFSDLLNQIQNLSLHPGKVCIVSDSNVAPLYEAQVKKALEGADFEIYSFVFEAGEENKNIYTVIRLYEYLVTNHFERKDILLALGGGVTGDLTGFTAATYLRGIDFIQIPTTLLSQVDSSVGGKTGVDLTQFKNMVGAFYQPRLVYMNLTTLQTLDDAQFASGMGEVLKTGLIRDAELFSYLVNHVSAIKSRSYDSLLKIVRRCCEIKASVVEEDPTEKGIRAILNFGHTLGHAIEKCMDFQMLHGQCVGVGMVGAAWLSMQKGYITVDDYQKILAANTSYDLPNFVDSDSLSVSSVLNATKSDKKMEQGRVKFILLKEIGEAIIDHTLTDDDLTKATEILLKKETV